MKREEIFEKLDKYMEDTLFYEDLPGLALGIGCFGENTFQYRNAVGYLDFPEKNPLKPEHVFHMCSISKLFTGAAILLLMEEGKLRLDQSLGELLPDISFRDSRCQGVTLQQMLTHTAGFWDVEDYRWQDAETGRDALQNYVKQEACQNKMLLWDPGTGGFRYSNLAYEILGTIVARVSGSSFDAFVKQRILEPLHMDTAAFLTLGRVGIGEEDCKPDAKKLLQMLAAAGLAMPHKKDEQKHIVHEPCYPYNRAHGPSSTLTGTVQDLEKWAIANLNRAFFKPETYELAWKEYDTVPNNDEKIGLSWFIRQQKGYTLYGHEGSDTGFRSSFWICPQLSLYIVVCSNMTKAPVKKINKKAFELITEIL